ncbi:MAG TPA: DUF2059 domain-containing protein [Terriglobales bacterium]
MSKDLNGLKQLRAMLMAVVMVLGTVTAAIAQEKPAPAEPPSREDVLKLMNVLHAREQFEQVITAMTKQMKDSARESYKKQHPEVTEARLTKLDQVFDGMPPAMTIDQLLDDIVPVYQRYLTKQDVTAVIAFYSSDVGQRFYGALPKIQEEGAAISDDKIADRVEAYIQRLTERMEQFSKEEEKN